MDHPRRTVGPRHRAQGFTLIELLVVIAIISVLMSILLPVLGRARNAAMDVGCQAYQGAIASAWLSYADSNNQSLGAATDYSCAYLLGDPAFTYNNGTGDSDYMVDANNNPMCCAPWYIALVGQDYIAASCFACPADPAQAGDMPGGDPYQTYTLTTGSTASVSPIVAGSMHYLIDPTIAIDGSETWMSLRRCIPMSYAANINLSWSTGYGEPWPGTPPYFYAPERSQLQTIEADANPNTLFLLTDFGNQYNSDWSPTNNLNPGNYGIFYASLAQNRSTGNWEQSNRHGEAIYDNPFGNGGHNFAYADGHVAFVQPMPGENSLWWWNPSQGFNTLANVENDSANIINYYTQQAGTCQQPTCPDGILPNGQSIPTGATPYGPSNHLGYMSLGGL